MVDMRESGTKDELAARGHKEQLRKCVPRANISEDSTSPFTVGDSRPPTHRPRPPQQDKMVRFYASSKF